MTLPDAYLSSLPVHIRSILRESVQVTLRQPDDFLKVRETLTRMGVASKHERVLYQSCHILHKQGRYFIVSFKELFLLDGKDARTQFTDEDRARRNTIANMLATWKLVDLVDPRQSSVPVVPYADITVIPYRDKSTWRLVSKYEIGKKKVSL